MGHKRTGGPDEGDVLEMVIRDVITAPAEATGTYYPVVLVTSRGDLALRHYHVPGARLGAVFVGGGAEWEAPAGGELYRRLCADLARGGVTALRIRFRQPDVANECVLDVLAGLHFLSGMGVAATAITGHAFGGAVALHAAANCPAVRAVVALATPDYGTSAAAALPRGCATLFAHGTADDVVPIASTRAAYERAREPKRLVLYEGAGHGLDEAADEAFADVRRWIIDHLRDPRRPESSAASETATP